MFPRSTLFSTSGHLLPVNDFHLYGEPAQPEQLAPVRSFWQLPCEAASLEARSIRQSNAGAHFHRNPSGPKTVENKDSHPVMTIDLA